jgi:transcriptional regulator NrdR family protein
MANKPCARTCPACKEPRGRAIDSRENTVEKFTRRRYKCLGCAHRWTTYEISEKNFIMLLKLRGAWQKAAAAMAEEIQLNQGEEDGRKEEVERQFTGSDERKKTA